MKMKYYSTLENTVYIWKNVIKKQKKLIFLIIFETIISTGVIFVLPYFSKTIIDNVVNGNTSVSTIIFTIITMVILQTILTCSEGYLSSEIWWRIINARFNFIPLRIRKYLTIPYEKLEIQDVLNLGYKAIAATEENRSGIEGMLHSSQETFANIIKMVTAFSLIIFIDPIIALIMVILAYCGFWLTKKARYIDKIKTWDALAPLQRKKMYLENISKDSLYAKDIRYYKAQKLIIDKGKHVSNEGHKILVKSNNRWIFFSFLIHVSLVVNEAVIYAWLIYSVLIKGLEIGDFTFYLVTLRTFFSTVSSFFNSVSDLKKQSAEISDFRNFIELTDEHDGFLHIPKENEYILKLQNVSYKYPNENDFILRDINIEIKQNEKLAIVGLNGAGKTTLIKLICGLLNPVSGQVLLNGVNINKYIRSEYFALFAPMFQETEIFAMSLAENVAMTVPNKIDKERVKDVLLQAGLGEKIGKMNKGVDTQLLKILHEEGVDLSGGEKQKVALARLLYKNSPFLILDEPTSALDAISEKRFYNDFNIIGNGKSIIYISHRLSSTKKCDNILLLSNGQVIESGTHDELIKLNGEYSKLYNMQAKYYKM